MHNSAVPNTQKSSGGQCVSLDLSVAFFSVSSLFRLLTTIILSNTQTHFQQSEKLPATMTQHFFLFIMQNVFATVIKQSQRS